MNHSIKPPTIQGKRVWCQVADSKRHIIRTDAIHIGINNSTHVHIHRTRVTFTNVRSHIEACRTAVAFIIEQLYRQLTTLFRQDYRRYRLCLFTTSIVQTTAVLNIRHFQFLSHCYIQCCCQHKQQQQHKSFSLHNRFFNYLDSANIILIIKPSQN